MTLIEEMKNEIDRLRVALLEAEAGFIMAGADVEPSGDFVPSPTAALRIVRTALVPNVGRNRMAKSVAF